MIFRCTKPADQGGFVKQNVTGAMTTALEDLRAKQKGWQDRSDAPGCGCQYCDGLRERSRTDADELQPIIEKLSQEIQQTNRAFEAIVNNLERKNTEAAMNTALASRESVSERSQEGDVSERCQGDENAI